MNLVTLYQVRAELGTGSNDPGTADDALLGRLIVRAQGWIERQSRGRFYDPRRQTVRVDAGYNRRLLLRGDLLEVLTLTNGDASEVDASTYLLQPPDSYPKYALDLRQSTTVEWLPDANGDYAQALALDGLWGYVPGWATAWADSLDAVSNDPLAADGTTILVSDPLAYPEDLDEPRFQAGQLIRLSAAGAFEYCRVRAVIEANGNTSASLTVERGVNGTTAQVWAADTPIAIFRPWANVQSAMHRIVAFSYRTRKGQPTERISVLGNSQQIIPGGIPADVLELLAIPAQVFG